MKQRHAMEGIIIKLCDFLCTSIFSDLQNISPGNIAYFFDIEGMSVGIVMDVAEYSESKYGVLPVDLFDNNKFVVSICLLGVYRQDGFFDEKELKYLGSFGTVIYLTKETLQMRFSFDFVGELTSVFSLLYFPDSYIEHICFPVRVKCPSFLERVYVHQSLLTGLPIIDCLIPIGHGQRVAVLGDFGAGKTTLVLTVFLMQCIEYRTFRSGLDLFIEKKYFLSSFIPCIYLGINKRAVDLVRMHEFFQYKDIMPFIIILYSRAGSSAMLSSVSPEIAMGVGEWFRERGFHAILVFDELYEHAIAYRELSLLLKRSPGREAFPGDLFAIHGRVLERSTVFSREMSGGSVTTFALSETRLHDYTSYMPTTLISICDGQIIVDKRVTSRVFVVKSISRMGSAARTRVCISLFREVYDLFFHLVRNKVKLALLEFLPVDQALLLRRGKRLLASLDVIPYTIRNTIEMVEQLYGIVHGFFDLIETDEIIFFFDTLKKKKEEHFYDFPISFNHFILPSNAFIAAFKQSTISSLGFLWTDYLRHIVKDRKVVVV
jgi:F0F1-type ATP synthase alpha subunit